VAASLIRYCGHNNIPLPRSAQKVLSILDGSISLMVSMDSAARPPKD
jgi:hypothetical protein